MAILEQLKEEYCGRPEWSTLTVHLTAGCIEHVKKNKKYKCMSPFIREKVMEFLDELDGALRGLENDFKPGLARTITFSVRKAREVSEKMYGYVHGTNLFTSRSELVRFALIYDLIKNRKESLEEAKEVEVDPVDAWLEENGLRIVKRLE